MSLLRNSAVMAAGTAVSRSLGLVQRLVLLAALGVTTMPANMFDTANKLPNILYMLLAGGVLNAVLVPQIVKATKRHDDGGQAYVNRLITLSVAVLLVVTMAMTFAAPWLVALYSTSVDPGWRDLAIAFGYWCIPQLFFYGLYTVLGQVLNAKGQFGAYMWAPAVNNIVAIIGFSLFIILYGSADSTPHDLASWTPGKIALVGGFATLGVACQALILIIPLRRGGFRYTPVWGIRGVGLRSASQVAMWTFAAILVGQLGLVVITNVANHASELTRNSPLALATPGSNAYTTALLLFMLPHSLVAVSLVTALFTRMSGNAAADDWPRVRDDLSLGLRTVGVFSVLATVGLLVLAQPVSIAMSRGNPVSGGALGRVVASMALGLIGYSAAYLIQRVCYAYEDARTPFLVAVPQQVIVVVACLLSSWLLPPEQMLVGVGIGISIGNTFAAIATAVLLRRRHGLIDGHLVLRTHVRLLIIGLISGAAGSAVVKFLPWRDHGVFAALACCVVAGVVITGLYLAGLRVFRVRELGRFIGRGRIGQLLGG